MCSRRRGRKSTAHSRRVSGGLGPNPVQNLVALASTKSHPIFHLRKCVAIATRPSHLLLPYRACIFDLHHPLLPSVSQSITPHLISPLWLAFSPPSLSCPPSNCWPSQMDGRWITMHTWGWGGWWRGSPVAPCGRCEGWKRESTPVARLGTKPQRPWKSWTPGPVENKDKAFRRGRRPTMERFSGSSFSLFTN